MALKVCHSWNLCNYSDVNINKFTLYRGSMLSVQKNIKFRARIPVAQWWLSDETTCRQLLRIQEPDGCRCRCCWWWWMTLATNGFADHPTLPAYVRTTYVARHQSIFDLSPASSGCYRRLQASGLWYQLLQQCTAWAAVFSKIEPFFLENCSNANDKNILT